MSESQFLSELRERLDGLIARAEALGEGLSSEQLNWCPEATSWSVGQCLEHTVIGVEKYLEVLVPLIAGARESGMSAPDGLVPKHSFMGKLVLGAVNPESTKKVSAPKSFAPGQSDISSSIVERYTRMHSRLHEVIGSVDGLNFNKLKLSSPVARIIRLNVADALKLSVDHAERHLNQAQRVVASSGFPS